MWYTPVAPSTWNPDIRTGSVSIANKLSSIQRRVLITISGALRSTATDLLEFYTNLLPILLTLNKACTHAAIRLASLPPSHPLAKPVAKAASRYVKHHRSPLHDLFHYTQISPSTLEKIEPTRHHPNFSSPIQTNIAGSRALAIDSARALHRSHNVRVYLDGSMYRGGVGATASLYIGSRLKASLTYFLGPDTKHTMYEAELVGVLLNLYLLLSLSHRLHNPVIGLDNQAAIIALLSNKPSPSQTTREAQEKETRESSRPHIRLLPSGHLDTRP